MNRREFLKGGLVGIFGAFLAWAGMVKVEAEAEEPVNPYDSVLDSFAKMPPLRPLWTEDSGETIHVTFATSETVWEYGSLDREAIADRKARGDSPFVRL